jgi:hypothetical protein
MPNFSKEENKLKYSNTGTCYFNVSKKYKSNDIDLLKRNKVDIINLEEIDNDFDLQIASLTRYLQIFYSDLSKSTLEKFYTNLNHIVVLNMHNSLLPKNFDCTQLPFLEELDIINQKNITFNNCKKLKSLIVRQTKSTILDLEGLDNLEILEIIQGKVKQIKSIESVKSLKALTIFNSKIETTFDLNELQKLDNLEYIHLSNYKNDISFNTMNKFKNLKCLILENCQTVCVKDVELDKLKFQVRIIGKTNLEKTIKNSLTKADSSCTYGYLLKDRFLERAKQTQ